jgi:outer membrane protein with beta-barrel domain
MRESLNAIPLFLLASLVTTTAATAGQRDGQYGFATNIGFAYPRTSNTYASDQTLNFAFEYEKTSYASYRGTAGFLTISGREPVSPAAGNRDADALYVTGNIVLTARFAILHPFFTAGLGAYSFRMSDNLGSKHTLDLGANWGIGMDIQLLRHFSLRGEYLFHYTTADITNPLETFTLGGRFIF